MIRNNRINHLHVISAPKRAASRCILCIDREGNIPAHIAIQHSKQNILTLNSSNTLNTYTLVDLLVIICPYSLQIVDDLVPVLAH